jgi:hypothetical protein
MILIRLLAMFLVFGGTASAWAAAYPVSGKWAYERPTSQADACRDGPFMEFKGDRRFDTGGTVPDYRNLSIAKTGPSLYQVVDLFFTGPVRGKVSYTLHVADADHLQIRLASRGALIKLRRCA